MTHTHFFHQPNHHKSSDVFYFIVAFVFLLLLMLFFCVKATSATTLQSKCLTCPENIVVSVDPNQCGAIVTYPIPSTAGCSTGTTLTFSRQSGAFFPTGVTTVNINTVSPAGTVTEQCSFTVTVVDNEAPKINCPNDITVNLALGQATAIVNFPTPAVTDNCGLDRVVFSPASGSMFPIGTTRVMLVAFDQAGNRSNCTFNVVVLDQEAPKIICPNDLVVKTLQGDCSAVVNYPPVTVSDNSNLASVIYSPPSGSRLPIGKTLVQVTATDRSGNSSNCSFNVTVNSFEPLRINCLSDISATVTNGQCGVVVNYPTPTVNSSCPGVQVSSSPPSGSFFSIGKTLVTVTASDATGAKATCTFNINVTTTQPPQIVCPADVSVSTFSEDCTVKVDYPPVTVVNDCLGTKVEYSIASGSFFRIGKTPVTVTVTDVSGNKTSCTFNVEVTSSPVLMLRLENDASVLNFGPVNARRKPKKLPTFRMFELENRGCVPLEMAFASMLRTGNDVIAQRITNPDDRTLFLVQANRPDRLGQRVDMGSMVALMPKEKRTFFILFQPLIPRVNDTSSLRAQEVLPANISSFFTITQANSNPVGIPLVAKVSTEVNLVDPIVPSRAPVVLFSRNGDEFTTEFSVYDSNLDVNRATFQFFKSNGEPVGQAITVDLSQTLQQSSLLVGQSFTVVQKFTGASDHPEYNSVQVTVFDSNTSDSVISGTVNTTTLVAPLATAGSEKIMLPVINIAPFN